MSLWINGQWLKGHGAVRQRVNPVTAETVWQGNDADSVQVEMSVAAARSAFPAWARLPLGDVRG